MSAIPPGYSTLGLDGLILEGLVTTLGVDGSVNFAPMGPIVSRSMDRFHFRPFQTSTTFANLRRQGGGVLHVTDNVDLIARAAIGKLDPPPHTIPAQKVEGACIPSVCRWYEFEVEKIDDADERADVYALSRGGLQQRMFFGFNRAMHAVIEAAILATRVDFLPHDEIEAEIQRLATIVEKTAAREQLCAFELLQDHIHEHASR